MRSAKRGLSLSARVQRDQRVEDQAREVGKRTFPAALESEGSSDAGASCIDMRSVPP